MQASVAFSLQNPSEDIVGNTEGFWRWFVERADYFGALIGKRFREDDLDAIMNRLHTIHERLYFEIGGKAGDCELIISAECDRELFPLVFYIIGQSPRLPDWRFTALKPAMGTKFGYQDNKIALDPDRLEFCVLKKEGSPLIGVSAIISDFSKELEQNYITGLWRLIETVIGEWLATEGVGFVEARAEPYENASVHPLSQLEEIVRNNLLEHGFIDPYSTLQ